MEYKVGDWCVCINLDGGNNGKIGHVFQIGEIDDQKIWYTYTKETNIVGGCLYARNFRLALPEEIPGYIPPKSENYKQLKRILKQLKIK